MSIHKLDQRVSNTERGEGKSQGHQRRGLNIFSSKPQQAAVQKKTEMEPPTVPICFEGEKSAVKSNTLWYFCSIEREPSSGDEMQWMSSQLSNAYTLLWSRKHHALALLCLPEDFQRFVSLTQDLITPKSHKERPAAMRSISRVDVFDHRPNLCQQIKVKAIKITCFMVTLGYRLHFNSPTSAFAEKQALMSGCPLEKNYSLRWIHKLRNHFSPQKHQGLSGILIHSVMAQ